MKKVIEVVVLIVIILSVPGLFLFNYLKENSELVSKVVKGTPIFVQNFGEVMGTERLHSYYAKGGKVYLEDQELVGVSPDGFQVIDSDNPKVYDTMYIKDDYNLFYFRAAGWYGHHEGYIFGVQELMEVEFFESSDYKVVATETGLYFVEDYASNKLYYLSGPYAYEIEGLDPKNYWYFGEKDNEHDENRTEEIWADKDTIAIIDQGSVSVIGASVDVETFKFISPRYSKDKNNVYDRTTQIIGADPETFEILENGFTRDKNHVFNPHLVEGFDPVTNKKTYRTESNVEGVDGDSFVVLNSTYSKDKNNVFSNGKILAGADTQTFELILNPNYDLEETGLPESKKYSIYAKDKYGAYCNSKLLRNSDPATFTVLVSNLDLARDSNNVYLGCDINNDLDPDTYKKLEHPYSVDVDSVFIAPNYPGLPQLRKFGANPETFEVITESYQNYFSKDDKNVYYLGYIIEGADPESFELIMDREFNDATSFSKDKENVYFQTVKVQGADPKTFEHVNLSTGKDSKREYEMTRVEYKHQ